MMKLWVNVCFHYVPERLENFNKLIKNLQKINCKGVKVVINSNINFNDDLQIDVAELADPFLLTWEHKKYMPQFLESDYTHFAYLEGNVDVSQKTFNYWLRTRKLFKDNNFNFIPGIHRIEIDKEGKIYSLDCTNRVNINNNQKVIIDDDMYLSLPEPYQGMFIMDREMVEEHIKSDYFNVGQKGWWGIRESANLGNTFIHPPAGFNHRVLVPMEHFSDCWVHHMTNNYVTNSQSPHSKILVDKLFHGN
jgi:hypothetical protein